MGRRIHRHCDDFGAREQLTEFVRLMDEKVQRYRRPGRKEVSFLAPTNLDGRRPDAARVGSVLGPSPGRSSC